MHWQIISDKNNDSSVFDQQIIIQNNPNAAIQMDLNKELGNERVKNVFLNIEKACLDDKVGYSIAFHTKTYSLIEMQFQINQVPTSDFIELYTHENVSLNQRIKVLTQQYEEISKEVIIISSIYFSLCSVISN